MLSVVVDIALATLCIVSPGNYDDASQQYVEETQECYPVLVGSDTPRGEYQLQQRLVQSPGYGGDILQFKEEELYLFAIHRVWLGRPWEKRQERLKSTNIKMRRITMGCINVDPEVYEKLLDCCSTSKLTVK